MSKTLHFRLGPALVLVVGPVVYLLSRYLELPVGVVVLVAAIALLANGVVASVEDDLPGGFNNPRGGERSSYLRWLRVALALVLLLFAVGFIQAFVLVELIQAWPGPCRCRHALIQRVVVGAGPYSRKT